MKKLTTHNTDLEVVTLYITSDDKESFNLSEKQKEILVRIDYVRGLMVEEVGSQTILKNLCEDFNIHISTAYTIYKTAYMVYDYRQILIDNTLKEINKSKELAILKENPAAAAQADKNRLTLIEKFLGTKDENFYEQLKPVDITIGNFPELTGVPQLSEKELLIFIKNVRKLKEKNTIINIPNTLESPGE